MNSRSSGQPKNDAKTLFSTLHPLSTVIFATATVLAFVLLRDSRFNFHSVKQRLLGNRPEVRCDLSRLLAREITKRVHSSKPASLNRLEGHRQSDENWNRFKDDVGVTSERRGKASAYRHFRAQRYNLELN